MSLHQRSSAASGKRPSTVGHSSSSHGRNLPADRAYDVDDEWDYEYDSDSKITDDLNEANPVVKELSFHKEWREAALGNFDSGLVPTMRFRQDNVAVESLNPGKGKLKAALEDEQYGYDDEFCDDPDIVNPAVLKLPSSKDKLKAAVDNDEYGYDIKDFHKAKAAVRKLTSDKDELEAALESANKKLNETFLSYRKQHEGARSVAEILKEDNRKFREVNDILTEKFRTAKEEIRTLVDKTRTITEEKRIVEEETHTAKEEVRALEEENITLKVEILTVIEEKRTLEEENRTAKEETHFAKEEIRALKEENATLEEETRTIIKEKRAAKERIRELEHSICELEKESVALREKARAVKELARYKFPRLLTLRRSLRDYRNLLSDYLQPKVSRGCVRISWTCRCGRRLRLEVPRNRQDAALAFALQASGPMNVDTISVTSSSLDDDSQSTTSSASGSTRSSNPPLDSPETELTTTEIENSVQRRFFPRGTKMYMLLCVNTGRRLIKLANVDVTDMDDDEKVFNKLREAYGDLRKKKWYSRLVKPKTMHYIKFRLLYLQKSQECVTHYEVNSIPSIKEVMREEYLYDPCPPEHGDVPIPPDIFMHIFKYPGDHIGMATEMLPKKLYSKVCWINSVHHSRNLPYGWGFYIVEEVDWALVAWWVFGMVVLLTTLTIAWSAVTKDVQGGTGIGSYSIAALALLVSVIILGTRSIEGTALDG